MEKPLVISPNELIFPPTHFAVQSKPVAFKVKTTAKKKYCVRPNVGLIGPGEHGEIQVIMNQKEKQPANVKTRDKFLIQVLVLEPGTTPTDLKELWKTTPEQNLISYKLKAYTKTPSMNSPVFTPTIPHASNIKEITESVEEDKFELADKEFDDATLNTSQPPPLATTKSSEDVSIQAKLNELISQNTTLTTERDELKKEILQLQAKIVSYEKEKQTLRQRKVLSTSSPDFSVQIKPPQQEESLLSNRLVQLIFVALLFFIIGKIL